MIRMNTFRIVAISFLFSFGVAAKPATQSASSSVHLDGKVKGIILNRACEPMAKVQITFSNKKWKQLIRPEQNGYFIVDLPAGDYLVSVTTPHLGEIKSSGLSVWRGKNGEVQLLVNTGIESTCSCFYDIEDALIPVETIIINTHIQERKLIPRP